MAMMFACCIAWSEIQSPSLKERQTRSYCCCAAFTANGTVKMRGIIVELNFGSMIINKVWGQ